MTRRTLWCCTGVRPIWSWPQSACCGACAGEVHGRGRPAWGPGVRCVHLSVFVAEAADGKALIAFGALAEASARDLFASALSVTSALFAAYTRAKPGVRAATEGRLAASTAGAA